MSGQSTIDEAGDPLAGVPGVIARVVVWDDGRVRELAGLDQAFASGTGHFVASVGMVLDTLVGVWSDMVEMDMAPLRTWAISSSGYWFVGAGLRAWLLDRKAADIGLVLGRLDSVGHG